MRDAWYLRSQAEICLHNCPFRACVANVSEMDHRNDWSCTRLSKPARRCLALWNVTLPFGSRVDWFDATGRAFAADSCLRLKGTTNRRRLVSPER
jgi:hypothetical protein